MLKELFGHEGAEGQSENNEAYLLFLILILLILSQDILFMLKSLQQKAQKKEEKKPVKKLVRKPVRRGFATLPVSLRKKAAPKNITGKTPENEKESRENPQEGNQE